MTLADEARAGRKDLYRANLYGADLRRADLSGADLYGANLYGANLYGADLRGVNLRDACLLGANLRGANLTGAHLRGANLTGADLRDADLRDADLRDADLIGADLRGAYLPSPTMVLMARWGSLPSPSLTADLMAYDAACHPDPSAFDRWARGGACPYYGLRVQRAACFTERPTEWDPARPLRRPYDLMVDVIREKCAGSDWHGPTS